MGKLTMPKGDMDRFLKEPWLASVATLTKTGHPHVTPIWAYYDGEHFYMSLMDGNPKTRALKRDNRIALSIGSDTMPYKAVLVHGTAELIRDDVRSVILKIAEKYVGREQADATADMLAANPQVIAKVTPIRIYTWDQSKGEFNDVAAAEKSGKEFRSL